MIVHRARNLDDVPKHGARVIHDRLKPPDIPSSPGIAQGLRRDGNVFGRLRRPTRQREHVNRRALREQCDSLSLPNAIDIARDLRIRPDRHVANEIRIVSYSGKVMLPAKISRREGSQELLQQQLLCPRGVTQRCNKSATRPLGMSAGNLGYKSMEECRHCAIRISRWDLSEPRRAAHWILIRSANTLLDRPAGFPESLPRHGAPRASEFTSGNFRKASLVVHVLSGKSSGQIPIEEINRSMRIFPRHEIDRLIVLGPSDHPEKLRLRCQRIQQSRLLNRNIAVTLAMNKQDRPRRKPHERLSHRRIDASELETAGEKETPPQKPPELRRVVLIDHLHLGKDIGRAFHQMLKRAIARKSRSEERRLDLRREFTDHNARRPPPRNPEEADLLRIAHLLQPDRKSTRLNSSHVSVSRMPSSA